MIVAQKKQFSTYHIWEIRAFEKVKIKYALNYANDTCHNDQQAKKKIRIHLNYLICCEV